MDQRDGQEGEKGRRSVITDRATSSSAGLNRSQFTSCSPSLPPGRVARHTAIQKARLREFWPPEKPHCGVSANFEDALRRSTIAACPSLFCCVLIASSDPALSDLRRLRRSYRGASSE